MIAGAAQADPGREVSGQSNGLSWTARSTIVGQTSSATVASGGDPASRGNGANTKNPRPIKGRRLQCAPRCHPH